MALSPDVLFRAWTQQIDRWFAAPGTALMRGEVDAVFYFETHFLLSHAGFADERSMRQHEEAWPLVLAQVEQRMSGAGA